MALLRRHVWNGICWIDLRGCRTQYRTVVARFQSSQRRTNFTRRSYGNACQICSGFYGESRRMIAAAVEVFTEAAFSFPLFRPSCFIIFLFVPSKFQQVPKTLCQLHKTVVTRYFTTASVTPQFDFPLRFHIDNTNFGESAFLRRSSGAHYRLLGDEWERPGCCCCYPKTNI